MITKEQALTCTSFKQIAKYPTTGRHFVNGYMTESFDTLKTIPMDKPIHWRANGKCKTWKRSPERFQLPIKHGLYNYGYITNENAHLFNVGD